MPVAGLDAGLSCWVGHPAAWTQPRHAALRRVDQCRGRAGLIVVRPGMDVVTVGYVRFRARGSLKTRQPLAVARATEMFHVEQMTDSVRRARLHCGAGERAGLTSTPFAPPR